jgi:hypothetical protein
MQLRFSHINLTSMKEKSEAQALRHDQFEHENLMWERTIEFFKQENAVLKTRLSIAIDGLNNNKFFKYAEYFQNQFLLKDEVAKKLESEITEQIARLSVCPHIGYISAEIQDKQEVLRREVSYFESDFLRMKNEFNQLISQES